MTNPQTNKQLQRRVRGAILERLVADLLDYSQRLSSRKGLHDVAISVQLHEGKVVKVAHCNSAPFPPRNASVPDSATAAPAESGQHGGPPSRSLPPDEINANLGLRLNRLLRHFAVRFGALHIEVDCDGTIKTICPSPPLRPVELRELARLLSGSALPASPHRSAPVASGLLKHHRRLRLNLLGGGRRARGDLL